MAFCTKCGQLISDDVNFCGNCGAPTSQGAQPPQQRARFTIFEGEIHKCPHCGEVLKSHGLLACPECGFEFRHISASTMMTDLKNKLNMCVSEQEQINIIRNFSVPKSKEELSELSKWAASNFDADYSASHQNTDDISDAYLSLLQKCYFQALDVLEEQSPTFISIKKIYDSVNAEKEKKKKEYERRLKKQSKKPFNFALFLKIVCVALCLMVVTAASILTLDYFSVINIDTTQTNIGISSRNLGKLDRSQIEDILRDKGFSDITVKVLEWDSDYYAGQVRSIAIDGDNSFGKFKKFQKNCHTIIYVNGDPKQINVGYSVDTLIGLNYEEVVELLSKQGFGNIEIVKDGWHILHKSGEVKSMTINGENQFTADSLYYQDARIEIHHYK